jgi:hypothetical protein
MILRMELVSCLRSAGRQARLAPGARHAARAERAAGHRSARRAQAPRASAAQTLPPSLSLSLTRLRSFSPTIRSFSTHGHQSAAKGSSTTVSRSAIRLSQLFIRLCGLMVRRWRLIGSFPILYNPPTIRPRGCGGGAGGCRSQPSGRELRGVHTPRLRPLEHARSVCLPAQHPHAYPHPASSPRGPRRELTLVHPGRSASSAAPGGKRTKRNTSGVSTSPSESDLSIPSLLCAPAPR